ncbi:outer membrane protein OmpA-like peptidoglycan-associated protein [Spinactinospora alkalitolerans]|uniref:Outer membrane protein OmpA-like peptidoglycan-associated protein n=1 Tax=Spinactinospora alkalitolerans TaxID=687207 RepID=A0A852U1E9_9ACTN|nr:OmpA family protein [Spinactinospora alkalitolerans]NYE49172.1 outer membrane protein OmpA-like peptidoglycan-associated protein [Spinactinospora alkalitolerans]
MTNKGSDNIQFFNAISQPGDPMTAQGATLVDMVNEERYRPLMLTNDKCHCSSWSGQEAMQPGDVIDIWVAFPEPPDDVEQMTVTTPATPDFLDIPVTEASDPDPAIADAAVAEPTILPLRQFQENVDGPISREDSNDETTVMLSSDVLFDLNESELTSEADAALEQVAQEVDGSEASTVRIDGYTDNSGNDAINNPLSEDRAAAVEERLKELVTRDGVSYEVAGHGSSDPVGDNSTEEGREKNRRVTVTFEK